MKRDMDLLRKILFYIEENYVAGQAAINVSLSGYSEGEIYEHCMLAYQSGLIQKPLDTSTTTSYSCMVNNLTNAGFDYLDSIRDDTQWNKIKKTIKDKGLPLIIGTVKTIATAFVEAAAKGVADSIIQNGGV